MISSMKVRNKSLLFVALLVSCSPEPTGTLPANSQVISLRSANEILVDVSATGDVLAGRTLPVPEESDADRTLSVRLLTPTGQRPWRYDNVPILEAHFIARSSSILVLTTEHELVRYDRNSREIAVIDRAAYGPVSLDEVGLSAAYTRGEPPELRVVRANIATGATQVIAEELYPAWCPSLSADGSSLLFVASPDGDAYFYRSTANSQAERWELPRSTPLPTGPTAAVMLDDSLTYESDGTLYTLMHRGPHVGTIVRTMPGAGLPVHAPGSPELLLQDQRRESVTIAVRELAVRP